MNDVSQKKHFSVLDSFRGICACLVAISHFNANSIFMGSHIFDRGSIWVDFFFVLSGFVIFSSYGEKLRSGFSASQFIFLRLGRLYPLHITILLAYICLETMRYYIIVHIAKSELVTPFTSADDNLFVIFCNISLIQSMGFLDDLSFNGPSWSISVEFYTYILFAAILVHSGRFYRIVTFLVSLTSLIFLSMHYPSLFAKLDLGFLRCVYGFGCGALTWEVYHQYQERMGAIVQKNKMISNTLEIGALILTLVYVNYYAFNATSFAAPLIFGAFILLFSFESGVVSKHLKSKIFLLLGTLSYSIYMIHMFVSGYMFNLPVRLLENKAGWDITVQGEKVALYGKDLISGTLFEIVYLLIVIAGSYITYTLIEEPCRKWSKKLIVTSK